MLETARLDQLTAVNVCIVVFLVARLLESRKQSPLLFCYCYYYLNCHYYCYYYLRDYYYHYYDYYYYYYYYYYYHQYYCL
jgi:hypothetical protein